MSDEKNLIWSGPVLDPSGYGEATRGYLLGIAKFKDLNTKLVAKNFWTGDPPDLRQSWSVLNQLSNNNFDRRQPHVFLQHLTPETYLLSGGNCKWHIGMTTFETTSVPAGWQIQMRAMDELFTFSQWGKEIFESTGIRRPVTVVPHGVDVVKFNPIVDPIPDIREAVGQDTFVFGSNFDWTERKNPSALLKAYFSSFKREDPVALVLKTYYQYPIEMSKRYITSYIDEVRHMLKMTSDQTPRIVLITDIQSSDWFPHFYASLDAYVLPSRGEGWGLTLSEAMATGLPTIAVNWSGPTEFMNEENSYLCKNFKLCSISEAEAGPQQQYIGHQWASVEFEELAHHMVWVYNNREAAKEVGAKARDTMVEKFTWAAAARTLKGRLDQIYAGF